MNIDWYYNGKLTSIDQDGHAVVNVNLILGVIKYGFSIRFIYYETCRCHETESYVSSLGISDVEWRKKSAVNRIYNLLFRMGREERKAGDGITILGSNPLMEMVDCDANRSILLAGDVETRKWYQNKKAKNLVSFMVSLIREAYYKKYKLVVVYNDKDVEYLKNKENLMIQPVCYNSVSYVLNNNYEYDLIFTGNFNYPPNAEAAEYLLKFINRPELRLCFAGFAANNYLERADNLIVKDDVKSLEEEIVRAKVFISPLLSGTGVKNKILSAINCAKPIICSDLSVEGVDLSLDGACDSIFLCSKVEEYKEAFEKINENYSFYEERARDLKLKADQRFSWNVFSSKLVNEIKKIK